MNHPLDGLLDRQMETASTDRSCMTTAELLAVLARECPNGVSFEPMAVRLLRQKVPFEEGQIEDLQTAMFQIGNGTWFSLEMIVNDTSSAAFEKQATD
jgi:hypothetical protein